MKTLFFIILTFFSTALFGQQDYLIPILKDGKYGYINLDGEIIIPFKYKKVQLFSEGLAGVREHGLYGFIDTEGKYSLPPIYDYVDTFSNGFAKVWIAGNCRLIDKMGNPLFVGNYSDLVWNKKRKQILVTTQMTNKKGVVNEKGEIIIDTLFNHLSKIQPNTYLIYDDSTELFGLINIENKVILPPIFEQVDNENDSILVGRISINKYVFFDVNDNMSPVFKEIISFEKHTLKIVTYTEKEGLYDTKKGVLLDTIYKEIHFIGKYLIRVKNQNDEFALFKINGQKLTDFGEYKHYYPTYGNLLIAQKDEKLEYGQLKFSVFDVYGHFIHTLSFENYEYVDKSISVNARNYLKIVNIETGEIKNLNIEFGKFDSEILEEERLKQEKENKRKRRKKIITHLLKSNTDSLIITYQPSYFDTDFHIVNVKKKGIEKTFQGLVNSDNVFIIPPNYERIEQHLYNANLFELIDFEGSNSLYDVSTKKIIVSNFDFIKTYKISHTQKKEFQYIYATTVDSLEIIFNSNLEPIWNRPSANKHHQETLIYMDIDSRKLAQYAVSQAKFKNVKKYKQGEIVSQKIENNTNKYLNFPDNQVSIIIDTTQLDTFNKKYWGYNIYIANTTNHSSVFTTQEGKLYLKTQAKDKNGKWCDIEYLPNTRYGHHFSENTLPSNDYWVFTIPIYQGIQKTEMRMVLMTSKKGNFGWQIETDESKWIYSESFEGYINPAQLWRFPESWSFFGWNLYH